MIPLSTETPKPGGRHHLKPNAATAAFFLSEKLMYYLAGFATASLLVWCLNPTPPPPPSQSYPNFSSFEPTKAISRPITSSSITPHHHHRSRLEPESEPDEINLPDPRVGKPIKDWDATRQKFLAHHPDLLNRDRILMITGSGPSPCRNPAGDYYLLRLFKNKVDYCRIHNCEIFYNSAPLQPKMNSYWAKYPVIRAAMIAHPEVEWIWWVDSDAAITDMSFKPLIHSRYADYNLIVQGWSDQIYGDKKSWYGANAGVFFIRNCQWSMDLMERWVSMGPISPLYSRWGSEQKSLFPDKTFPESDDQTGLLYLLAKEKEKWGDKVYIEENQEDFQLFWMTTVDRLKNEKLIATWSNRLGKRRPERFGADAAADDDDDTPTDHAHHPGSPEPRIPFITHFPGCQPCHSKPEENQQCYDGMEMVLNFADNQVLFNYGYVHPDLHSSSLIDPLPGLSD